MGIEGYFAYSLAGRDRDKLYLIIKEDGDCVWLVDGNVRTLKNPKRKNKRHIQIIKKYNWQTNLGRMTDAQIKYIMKKL